MSNKLQKILIGCIVLCLGVLCCLIGVLHNMSTTNTSTTDIQSGVSFIKNQENLELDSLEKAVKEVETQEKREARVNGTADVFSLFDDYVFYGDSRVKHFVTYGYLPEERVFADNSMSYEDVYRWDEMLADLNPSNVFVAFGNNDIAYGLADEYEGGYGTLVESSLNEILSIVPNAKIYVCGIIPPSASALEKYPHYARVSEYNQAIQEVCDKMEQCTYIDDEVLAADGTADIYVEDLFHFKSEFYPTWASYIFEHIDF